MFIRFDGAYNVELIDSDFVELNVYRWEIVIDIYEKRRLNVAANLALAFVWQSENVMGCPISKIVSQCKKEIPKYTKYEAEVNKYLMLV